MIIFGIPNTYTAHHVMGMFLNCIFTCLFKKNVSVTLCVKKEKKRKKDKCKIVPHCAMF